MPSARLTLREEDVVRLALEFLYNRELHISQLSLERETGVINGNYSDDVLFLRQLILDGQWDDVLEFIQPLEALKTFNMKKFCYTILKHKYIELLCIKSEANVQGNTVDNAVEEVVKVLNDLEKYAATKEEYSTLCLLLTLPRLSDHLLYKDWNPSNARVQCFREIFPLVSEFLPGDRGVVDGNANNNTAKNDRLIQLIIKGILYESCVNYCQTKATGGTTDIQSSNDMSFSKLLDGSVGFSDSDLSLLSWLQSVPSETFSVPFEQRTLNVDVEKLERPSLETSWTEHMLVTPIKPKTFPHSAMPFTRPRSAADMMTRSLMPVLDGLPYGLAHSTNENVNAALMALSTGDIGVVNGQMSKSSFASFHLTGLKNNKSMNASVDRLFENECDVFLSNSYLDFQNHMSPIQEHSSTPKISANNSQASRLATEESQASRFEGEELQSSRLGGGELQPTRFGAVASQINRESFTNRLGGDSQTNRILEDPCIRKSTSESPKDRDGRGTPSAIGTEVACRVEPQHDGTPATVSFSSTDLKIPSSMTDLNYSGELVREYHKSKQKLQEQLAIRDRERGEMLRQINGDAMNAYSDNGKPPSNSALNGRAITQSPRTPNGTNLRGSGEGGTRTPIPEQNQRNVRLRPNYIYV